MADKSAFMHPPFKIGWHHFIFTLPLGWELVSYGMDPDSGIMSFASESGVCGQLSWRKVKAVPDIERIIAEVDWRSRPEYAEGKPGPALKFETAGQGIIAYSREGERFYASVFLQESRILAEWIFPSFSEPVLKVAREMISGFRENLPDEKSMCFYAAFGLEVKIPSSFSFSSIEAYPAAVSMSFLNSKKHSITAHRWGMASMLLSSDSVGRFYHRFLYKIKYVIKNMADAPVFGFDGSTVSFRTRGHFGFDFLLGSWWRGTGSCIHVPSENRIYAVEHVAPNRIKDRLGIADICGCKLKSLMESENGKKA